MLKAFPPLRLFLSGQRQLVDYLVILLKKRLISSLYIGNTRE